MGIVQYISQYSYLSKEDAQQINTAFEQNVYSKPTLLLKENTYAKQLYFLESGFMRSFYRKNDGSEKTHWIYQKNDIITAWHSFFTDQPCFENLETIGTSVVASISLTNYNTLYQNNETFNVFINGYYQNVIAEMDFLIKTFTHLSAKEKYRYLLKSNPEMIQHIKLGYLASLLDISQETLSRVRKDI